MTVLGISTAQGPIDCHYRANVRAFGHAATLEALSGDPAVGDAGFVGWMRTADDLQVPRKSQEIIVAAFNFDNDVSAPVVVQHGLGLVPRAVMLATCSQPGMRIERAAGPWDEHAITLRAVRWMFSTQFPASALALVRIVAPF